MRRKTAPLLAQGTPGRGKGRGVVQGAVGPAEAVRATSELEAIAINRIERAGLPAPVREFYFAKPRMWRLDLCWPDQKLAVEVEGGTWSPRTRGHTSGAGYQANLEKYNAALLLGWRVLRYNDHGIKDGTMVEDLKRALEVA